MRNSSKEIITTKLCAYGCGNIAKYQNGSKTLMCTENHNSCPQNKIKNSIGVKNAFDTGIRKPVSQTYKELSQEKKDKMKWNKGLSFANFTYGGKGQHKNALIQERGYRCECCGLSEWMGEEIPLEMEHIDADRKNNAKENLKLLCLNCHGQTPTWKIGKATGKKLKKYTDEIMIDAIKNSTCLNQVLTKLDLRYGSAKTIVDVMIKYKVTFKEE